MRGSEQGEVNERRGSECVKVNEGKCDMPFSAEGFSRSFSACAVSSSQSQGVRSWRFPLHADEVD